MKSHTIIATGIALLLPLLGCKPTTVTTTTSGGSFNVDSNTGLATGQAFGISFNVAGASGVETTTDVSSAPGSSSQLKYTLADDLTIQLETVNGESTVAFQVNGQSFGSLQRGDEVAIAEDRGVTVNGETRAAAESPSE